MKIIALLLCILNTGNLYTQSVEVIEVTDNDLVTTVDSNGNIWQFHGYGYEEGNFLNLIIDSCGTENIVDDIVIDVK